MASSLQGQPVRFTFKGGIHKSNYETLGAVATKSFTVPSGKRWIFQGLMYVERDANATLDIALYDADDKKIADMITQVAAGTTNLYFPEAIAASAGDLAVWEMMKNMVLQTGWYIKVTWGAAQTTPEVACPVLEIEI
jgi:hypothetical protein